MLALSLFSDYEDDFEDEESKGEFFCLITQAKS